MVRPSLDEIAQAYIKPQEVKVQPEVKADVRPSLDDIAEAYTKPKQEETIHAPLVDVHPTPGTESTQLQGALKHPLLAAEVGGVANNQQVEQVVHNIPTSEPTVNEVKTPTRTAADEIAKRLDSGEKIANNRALFDVTDAAYGGTQAEGKYTVKDAYDAMELGINTHLRNRGYNPSSKSLDEARADIEQISKEILDAVPTQANRTAEQVEFQQFSTPPNIAYAANWLLQAKEGDTVLEPSAGIGGLAVFAKNAGARVVVNELSERRADILREMGFDEVYTENGEHIHNILPETVKPNKVIMNPPFSSTAGRIEGQKNTKNATLHVEQALDRLEDGGRAVLILGKGMADDAAAFKSWWGNIKKKYNVRANVEMSGKDYRKYGTSFGNVLVVVDKTGPTPQGGTVTGKYDSVLDALGDLEKVRSAVVKPQKQGTGKTKGGYGVEHITGYELQEKSPDGIKPVYDGVNPTLSEPTHSRPREGAGDKSPSPESAPQVPNPDSASTATRQSEMETEGKGSQHYEDGDFNNKSVAQKERNVKSDSAVEHGKNVPSLRYEWGEKKLPTGVTWSKSAVYTAKNKYVEGSPIYNKVEFLPIGDDMLIRLNPAKILNKEPKVLTIKDYKQHDALDLIREFCGDPRETLGRHFEDGVLKVWHEAGMRLGWSEMPRSKQEDSHKEEKPQEQIAVEKKGEDEKKAQVKFEDDNSVYNDYTPAKLKIPGAKPHPADLVQSAAMAAVEPPDPTYKPRLPKEMIDSGKLSEAQLEAVVYAGQSFEQVNPDGTRRGFFIGDGTGVGKGREISGILTDQLAQGRGKGKAVWVSMNEGLMKDARRDWEGVGNNPEDIFSQKMAKPKDGIKHGKGIAFTAYTTLRSKERLEQLKAWLGKDFDGVIALDEAHNANNAMDQKGERGVTKASLQSVAVQDLTKAFPDARVLYVSATGATEVKNLAMLDRLGLWGEGTPFPSKQAFVSEIEKGGTAAMELVARDMKAMGLYIARSLSYRAGKYGGSDNVTFRRLEHPLNDHQKLMYNRIAEAWQSVLGNIDEAVKTITGESKSSSRIRSTALAQFWSSHQRAFNQIITSIQTPSVINAIEKDLKDGKSVVIQLTKTNEADQKRALAKLEEGDTLDDLDITPRDALLNFLKNSFPVHQQQEVMDESGNKRLMPVMDSKGNPVLNKQAVKMRDEMTRDIASIAFPESPIDMIVNHFGADKVAEITGRSERVINKDGKKIREKLPVSAREADKLAFQDGKKRILIFSEAGGTGASYHADKSAKNQQPRVHYLLEPGWQADKALQGLGRSHRSNEAHKPEYVLVTTDLPGQKRFLSTIARRLEQLGALTTGERKTTTQGLFSERDNLEGKHAQAAVDKLFDSIVRHGVDDISASDLLNQLGLRLIDEQTGQFKPASVPKVPQFLNRLLSLKKDTQIKVFEEFEKHLDAEIKYAMDRGELDVGTETLKADSIEVLQETVVHKDEARGTETKYVELEASHRQKPNSFVKNAPFYVLSKRTGNVLIAKPAANVTNAKTGEIEKQYIMSSIDPHKSMKVTESGINNEKHYEKLSVSEAEGKWKEQAAAFPAFRSEKKHLITGAILPIWDRLEGHPRIFRVVTKDKQTFLGRMIEPSKLAYTLKALGTAYNGKSPSAKEVLSAISKPGTVAELANGWKIKESRVNGEKRIELVGADFTYRSRLNAMGLTSETISWKERWFVPVGDEGKMEVLLKASPVVEMRKSDVIGEAATELNEGKEDFDVNDYAGLSVKLVDGNPFALKNDTGSSFSFENEETEKRYTEAKKGVKRAQILGRIGESLNSILDGLKSDFPLLTSGKFDFAHEAFRRMNRKRGVAVNKAILTLQNTVKDMSPGEYDLFSRKRILDDLVYQKQDMPDSALPYGLTDDQLFREHKRVTDEADKSEKVQNAIAWEEKVVSEINENMITEAESLGWHSLSEKFNNPHYFRHVVLDFANAAAGGRKVGLQVQERRGYLKKRKGSERDISAHYIQAMGEVRALQLQDIETMKTLREIKGEYDVSENLKRAALVENEKKFMSTLYELAKTNGLDDISAAGRASEQWGELGKKQAIAISQLFDMAKEGSLPEGNFSSLVREMGDVGSVEDLSDSSRKQLNRYLSWLAGLGSDSGAIKAKMYFAGIAAKKKEIKNTLGKEHLTWRDFIPEDHVEWHPFQNRLVFSVNTVAENLVNQALDAGLEELNIPVDMLEKMRVLGGHRQTWVIPAPLAETLNKMGAPAQRTSIGKIAKEITTSWKKWVLLSPFRVFKYNVRNITGDADAVMAANPASFKYMPQAFQELANVFVKGKAATGELAEYEARGGSLGAQHIQELGNDTSITEFKRLLSQGEKGLLKLPKKMWYRYWDGARNVSDFRENVLRYATYLSYLDQMERNDGNPENWGASKKNEVLANESVRDRAFKMANELLGAYDQVSESGQQLRDITIPFYSWMEVNMKRYAQIFRNGMESGDIGEVTKRTVMGQVMKSPVYAWKAGKTAFKVSLFWMMVQAFNRLVMGDDDDDLTPDIQSRPHITLGRDSRGRVTYFDRIGAFADVLDWFALDSAYTDIKDILNGYQTVGDYIKKMAQAPASKLINALNPLIKTPMEMVSGQRYFPDAFNPRSIRDMGVYLADTLGLSPEFVALTGRPSPGYVDGRVRNMFTYSQDPDEGAYWWIADRQRRFQENVLGTSWSGGATTARGLALSNMKRAMRFDDKRAFDRYLRQYAEFDGSASGLQRSIESMAPMSGLSAENQVRFYKWLSAEDRRYLPRAMNYYKGLYKIFQR